MIEQAERAIFALRGNRIQTRQRLLETAVDEELDRLQQSTRDNRQIPGLATGLDELDRLLGGLQDGRLYIVAARPSWARACSHCKSPGTPRSPSANGCCSHHWR
jgi:replicative DNA helicase